jgi:hypothetical protein
MEKETTNEHIVIDKGLIKIYIGIAIIIFSPLLGTLLFNSYINAVGSMISTDGAIEMFWFSCILAMIVLGIVPVIIGCIEKVIEHKGKIND